MFTGYTVPNVATTEKPQVLDENAGDQVLPQQQQTTTYVEPSAHSLDLQLPEEHNTCSFAKPGPLLSNDNSETNLNLEIPETGQGLSSNKEAKWIVSTTEPDSRPPIKRSYTSINTVQPVKVNSSEFQSGLQTMVPEVNLDDRESMNP